MAVLSSVHDPQAQTLTITAEFKAPPDHVWALWQDPHKLERWWGPPGWPATFLVHTLEPGSRSDYFMTGPNGVRSPGWISVLAANAPKALEFDDGFSDPTGVPDRTMPTTHGRLELNADGARTRMTLISTWDSPEDMQKLLDMGMEEGMKLAMGQMDALLEER